MAFSRSFIFNICTFLFLSGLLFSSEAFAQNWYSVSSSKRRFWRLIGAESGSLYQRMPTGNVEVKVFKYFQFPRRYWRKNRKLIDRMSRRDYVVLKYKVNNRVRKGFYFIKRNNLRKLAMRRTKQMIRSNRKRPGIAPKIVDCSRRNVELAAPRKCPKKTCSLLNQAKSIMSRSSNCKNLLRKCRKKCSPIFICSDGSEVRCKNKNLKNILRRTRALLPDGGRIAIHDKVKMSKWALMNIVKKIIKCVENKNIKPYLFYKKACRRSPKISTAFGLGQITRSSFFSLFSFKGIDGPCANVKLRLFKKRTFPYMAKIKNNDGSTRKEIRRKACYKYLPFPRKLFFDNPNFMDLYGSYSPKQLYNLMAYDSALQGAMIAGVLSGKFWLAKRLRKRNWVTWGIKRYGTNKHSYVRKVRKCI